MISTERSPPWGRFSALMRAISSSSRLGWVAVKGDGAARAAASMMASNSPCSERWLARARWRRVSTTSSGAFLMERVTGMAPLWRRIGGGSRVVLGGWVESKNFHMETERRREGKGGERKDFHNETKRGMGRVSCFPPSLRLRVNPGFLRFRHGSRVMSLARSAPLRLPPQAGLRHSHIVDTRFPGRFAVDFVQKWWNAERHSTLRSGKAVMVSAEVRRGPD